MNDKKHITFESNGITVKCAKGSEIKILSIDNLSPVKTEYQTAINPFMAGAQTTHINVKETVISISMIIPNKRRDFYLNFFRINSTGKLIILWGDSERFNEYIVAENKVEQVTIDREPILHLKLLFSYPYFKDVYSFGEDLRATIPMLATPYVRRKDTLVASYAKFDREYLIHNTGEVPVGIFVRIKTRNATKNPKIFLVDKPDIFIRVFVDLQRGDKLEISTISENGNTPDNGKEFFVKLNGVNILNRTDQFSTFFQIELGEQKISYEAEDGIENMELWLWRNWAWSWV